jgi:diketogulonate reductase-like aldo/keto reductase
MAETVEGFGERVASGFVGLLGVGNHWRGGWSGLGPWLLGLSCPGTEFSHPGTASRLAALRAVAAETGATANQVVLAWLMGGEPPVIPLAGASSVAQSRRA